MASAAAAASDQTGEGRRLANAGGCSKPARSKLTIPSGSPRARASKVSLGVLLLFAAVSRSGARAAMRRYSSTCIGDACSHAMKRADSLRSGSPLRFSMNHSLACSAIAARIWSSLGLTGSPQARHAAAAVIQGVGQISLHHAWGYLHLCGDVLVTESIAILQDHGGGAPERQLLEHLGEPRDPLGGIGRRLKSRHRRKCWRRLRRLDRHLLR